MEPLLGKGPHPGRLTVSSTNDYATENRICWRLTNDRGLYYAVNAGLNVTETGGLAHVVWGTWEQARPQLQVFADEHNIKVDWEALPEVPRHAQELVYG